MPKYPKAKPFDIVRTIMEMQDAIKALQLQTNAVATAPAAGGTFDNLTVNTLLTAPDTQTWGVNGWSVETLVSTLTPAAGFSTAAFTALRLGSVLVAFIVGLNYTGATLTASSSGNLTDTLACTLPANCTPNTSWVAMYDKAGVANGSLVIDTGGGCTLKSLSPTATLASGDSVNFSATYPST